jgi:transcriptional regulator GlxA family with amidase domain
MHEIKKTQLILIPSLNEETIKYHEDAIPWLLKHYNRGTHIAAMCTGTFLLAGTGLLDHKTATTHWGYTDLFMEMFPSVNLKPERLITDEGDLYCCGASNACFDLSLYLVEKLVGREIALQTAKVFICDMNRINQSEWAIFRFQKKHRDNSIRNAQEFMEKNYADIKSVDDIAEKVGMSRRAFERRFKAATGDTPLKYLQRIRVEAAKRMIETQKSSFDEITYQVGYDNSSYFRKIFTKLCNMTPKLYRLKWGSDFPASHI